MTLRKAALSDLDTILHHRCEMFREMGYGREGDELSRAFFEKYLSEGNYHGWFFEDEEQRVVAGGGVVLIEYHPSPVNPHERRPWVVNMYTEPGSRRLGLARRLMETIVDWTRNEGYTNLFLHASTAGRPLYEALGFAAGNEMKLKLNE